MIYDIFVLSFSLRPCSPISFPDAVFLLLLPSPTHPSSHPLPSNFSPPFARLQAILSSLLIRHPLRCVALSSCRKTAFHNDHSLRTSFLHIMNFERCMELWFEKFSSWERYVTSPLKIRFEENDSIFRRPLLWGRLPVWFMTPLLLNPQCHTSFIAPSSLEYWKECTYRSLIFQCWQLQWISRETDGLHWRF